MLKDSPLSVETPAVPAHDMNSQPNAAHHIGRIALIRHYVTRAIQDVVKPAIKTFLETCNVNPRIAGVAATPALLVFFIALAFLTISTLVLVMWTILTTTLGIILIIIGGIVSLSFKLLLVVLATMPLVGIAIGLLTCANTVSQSIISRIPQTDVGPVISQTVSEIDWKSVVEHLVNFGKKIGPGCAAVLRAALHNSIVAFKETASEVNSNTVHPTPSVFDYTELSELGPTGSTEPTSTE